MSFSMMFTDTAQPAFIPRIVGPPHVSEATARLQSTDTTMGVAGPGLASLLLLLRLSAPFLYFISAATAMFSTLSVGSISTREPERHEREPQPFWTAIRTGLRFVVIRPALRVFLTTNALINTGAGVFATMVTLIALDDFAVPPEQYPLAGAAGAVGGILGWLVG